MQPTPIARTAVEEADFLAALAPGGLIKVMVGCLLGALLGTAVGRSFLRQYEARAVFRAATLSFSGPVIPLAELKARAASRDLIQSALTAAHSNDPPEAYRVQADFDENRDATVLTLLVAGAHPELAQAVCTAVVEELTRVTHEAYEREVADEQKRLRLASQAAEALTRGTRDGPGIGVDAAAAVVSVEKWVGELETSRQFMMRSVLDSRDSEVIDKPYVRENPTRTLLLTALGAFAGMLVGLSFASRPRRSAPRG